MDQRGSDLQEILAAALERPAGPERQAYLASVCGTNAALRESIEELLTAHGRVGSVFDPPDLLTAAGSEATTARDYSITASQPIDPSPTVAHAPQAGDHPAITVPSGNGDGLPPGMIVRYFGDYEIRNELGRGGMGIVYLARQVSLNRPVALKVVRAGLLAGDDELRRFKNEAEAVALLDHPGIVPIYEVGEHEGQHYFSMKLVPGGSLVPLLDRYKDDFKAVASLVAEAAEAVAHAHARGILHRDLKPANILVDDQGHPHVTDFGLAKKVEADVEFTQSGAILGTPAYMSPEQATGRRGGITTATDVHGLGALLYALLTGRAPFGGDSVVETIDAVRSAPPQSPRKLNSKLPRDLETICLKCLEKDPRRRYATTQALADDLHAWLESRPIAARRVGAMERAWLWCKRRPAVAVLTAAVFLAAVGGTAGIIVVQAKANADLRAANQRVEQRYELAVDAIKTFHTGVSQDFLLGQDQFKDLRDRLLRSAQEFYGKLSALLGQETDRPARMALADSNFELAELTAKVGRPEDALASQRAVLAARRALAARPTPNSEATIDVGESLISVGSLLDAMGRASEALQCLREAEAALASLSTPSPQARALMARCRSLIGAIHTSAGRGSDALAMYRLARTDLEAVASHGDAPVELRSLLAETLERIALRLHETDRPAESEAEHRNALAILEDLLARDPTSIGLRQRLAAAHHLLGMLLGDTGKLPEAEVHHRRAITLLEELMKSYPALGDPREVASSTYNDLAYLLVNMGRAGEAEALYQRAVALSGELLERNPTSPHLRHGLATCRNNLAMLLQSAGRLAEAEQQQRAVVELFESMSAGTPESAPVRSRLAISRKNLGLILIAMDRLGEAEREHRKALEILAPMAATESKTGSVHTSRAGFQQSLAVLLSRAGRHAEAEAEARSALATLEAAAAANPTFTDNRNRLAGCLNVLGTLRLEAGDLAEADAAYRRALSFYSALHQENPKSQVFQLGLATCQSSIADIDRRQARLAESLAGFQRSATLLESLVAADAERPAYLSGLAAMLRRRAMTRKSLGDPSGAVEDARRSLALYEAMRFRKSDDWLATACCHAVLASLAGRPGSDMPESEETTEAGTAMDLLQKAVALGCRSRGAYGNDDALNALHNRDDFRLLMLDLAFPAEPFVPWR